MTIFKFLDFFCSSDTRPVGGKDLGQMDAMLEDPFLRRHASYLHSPLELPYFAGLYHCFSFMVGYVCVVASTFFFFA
jgi:hypothetical protein